MNPNLLAGIRQNMESMSSEELLAVWTGNDRERWSDAAFVVVRNILTDRGVSLPPQQDPAEAIQEMDDAETGEPIHWMAIASFNHPGEAHIALARLETEGVDGFLDNEHIIAANFLYANATGGVRVMVAASDAVRAREILAAPPMALPIDAEPPDAVASPQPVPETEPLAALWPYPPPSQRPTMPCCPQCRSRDVRRDSIKRRILGIPLIIMLAPLALLAIVICLPWILRAWAGRDWECNACGHTWPPAQPTSGFPVVFQDASHEPNHS